MALIKTIQTAIVDTGYTDIDLPAGVTSFRAFSLWTENGSAYKIANDAAGNGEIDVVAGLPLQHSFEKRQRYGTGKITLTHIKATSGNNTNIVGTILQ